LSHNARMARLVENGGAAAALKSLRERSGLGVREVARLLDLPSSTYATYERSYKKDLLPVDLAKKLGPILAGRGSPPITPAEVQALGTGDLTAGIRSELRPAPEVAIPPFATLPLDLPVYGTAAGSTGDGAFLFSQQDVVDYVRRPAGLVGNKKAYGVYVEGDSMHPAYKQGDLIIADPARPPRPGDGVVIVCAAGEHAADGQTAFVKEFVRQTATQLVVKQYNPEKELTFDRTRVASVHRILTTADLMGV
jgi:phage repressor protein C with HTH and peptisase S24 domain